MSPFIERLGWVLIHSLWQLALLAAVAFVVQRAMQRTSAAARYAALLALLGLVVAAPLITWSILPTPAVFPVAELPAPEPALVPAPASKLEPPAPVLAPAPVTVGATAPITPVAPAPLEPIVPVKAPEPLQPTWSQWVQQSITPWLSTIVWGWSLGVLAFAIRPLWSWFTVRQLRTQGVSPVSESVQAALAETARRLGISQAVRVLQSTIVQVPIVAGYLKPVILLPASIVTGLPASQLEAILAHELAHIRRHDYLANLIQTLVETVFFYHPAVWWLSHQIRSERENCCDDIAVAMLGNRLDYSRALLAVEELRGTPTTLAVGASGGSLLGRVRRLFHRDVEQLRLSNGSITLCGLIGIGLIALAAVASTNHDGSSELFVPGAKAEIEGFGTIEVLGLRFVDSEWWSPDGSNLSASVDLGDPIRHLFNDDPLNGRQIGIVTRFSGVDSLRASRVHLHTSRAGGHHGSWSSMDRRTAEQSRITDIRFCSTNLSPEANSGELKVLLSFDAWSPWYTIDLKSPEASQNEGPLAPIVGRTPSSLAATQCEIGLQFKSGVHEEIHYEQIALDAAGTEISPIGYVGNHTLGLRTYSVPEPQVAKLKYRVQRYTHEVRYRNVSLKAGHRTEPQVSVKVLHRPERPASFSQPIASPELWPQLGGSAAHNPVSTVTNLPTAFDLAKEENIRWSQPIGDFAFSSPVASGGKVLIGTNNAIGRDPRFPASIDRACLQCFDERTGEFLWQYSSPKMEQGRRHDWPSIGICSTPVIEGDRVWFATNRCEIVCLDLNGHLDNEDDGEPEASAPGGPSGNARSQQSDVVWKYDMFNTLGVRPLNATCVTPVIAGDLLLLNSGNDVDESYQTVPAPEAPAFLAFHKTTGQLIWSDKTPNPNILGNGCSMGAPAVAKIDGVWQAIFAGYDGWLYAFDLECIQRGETLLLWKFDLNPKESQYQLNGPRNEFTYRGLPTTPVVVGNHVFAAVGHNPERGEGLGRLWCIDATKRGDLSSDLVYNKSAPEVVIPHKRGQACEPDKGDFTRPNPNSGVEWVYTTDDLNKNGQIEYEEQMHLSNSLPAIHGGLLLTTDLSGLVHCLDVTTGELLWTHDQLATCWSGPLLADGKAWVIDEDGDLSIFALSREKQLIAEIAMNSPGYTNFAAANQTLYVATKTQLVAIGSEEFPKPNGVTAKLPGGLEIELVGVTPNAAATSEGWRVDGTLIEGAGHWPRGATFSNDGDRFTITTDGASKLPPNPLARDLLFESRGLRSHPSWVILNQKGWTQFESVNADETIRRRLSYLPKESGQPLTVEMALTDSPWGPWQQIDKSGKRINTITTFEPDQKLYEEIKFLRFGPALEGNTQRPLELVLEEPATHDDYQSGVFDITVRFIGTDQKVWTTYAQPKPRQNGRRQVVWRTGVDVPLEKIDHVEYRLRPYRHFITFKNVPLDRTAGAQVTVEHRSLPLPPTQAPDPRFTAQIPGGGEIELLRIVRNDLPEDQSWTPDTKPSPGRLDWPQRSRYKVRPDGNGYSSSNEGPGSDRAWDFAYEVRSAGSKPFVSVDVVGEGSTSSSQFLPAIGPRLVTVLPKDPKSLTAFQLRVGTEPWGEWIQVGADGEILNPEAMSRSPNSPEKLVTVSGAGLDAENLDRSWIKWLALPNGGEYYQMEVRAIDDDGKIVESRSSSTGPRETTRSFELPLDRLARFEYRLRPYRHLVRFDQICTDPKKPTEVKVTVDPIVYPEEIVGQAISKAQPLVAKFPGGLEVELVGVTKNFAPAKEGWNPDGSPIGEVEEWPSRIIVSRNSVKTSDTDDGTSDPAARDLLVEMRGLKLQPEITLLDIEVVKGWSQIPHADPYRNRLSLLLNKPSDTLTFRMAMSVAPWGPYQQVGLDGKLLNEFELASPEAEHYSQIRVIRCGPHPDNPEQSELTLEMPEKYQERYSFAVHAIDTDGKEMFALSDITYDNSGKVTAKYRTDPGFPGKIARWEYRLRPYRHFIKFENVSFEPGRKTEPKVSVESIEVAKTDEEPVAQSPTPEAQQPRVDLIGLTYDSVPKKETWNANGQPLPAPDWVQRLPKLYGDDKSQPAPLYLFEVHGLRAKPSFRHRYQPAVVSGDDEVPEGRPYRMAVLYEDLKPEERNQFIIWGEHPAVRITDEPWGPWRTITKEGQFAEPVDPNTLYREGYDMVTLHGFRPLTKKPNDPEPAPDAVRTGLVLKHPMDYDSLYAIEVEAVPSTAGPQLVNVFTSRPVQRFRNEAKDRWDFESEWPVDPTKIDHLRYRIRPYRHRFEFQEVADKQYERPVTSAPFKVIRTKLEHDLPKPVGANTPSIELQVVDVETGQPIAGAEVTVRQAISSWQPKRPDVATAKLNISVAVPESLSTLRTSETGHFSFTTPPELRNWLSELQLSIRHPDYVIEQSFGAFQVTPEMAADPSLLAKKVFPGGLIKLKRGHEISGLILGPDGQPAVGVKLYAAWQMPQYLDMPPHAVTDDQGRYKFRTVKETESDLIFAIPQDAVAVSFPLKSKYGEHPPIQLERGTVITGQVLDQDGKPLAGAVVQANGSDSVYDGFPKPMARVLTDSEGRYRLPPQKLPVDVRVSSLGWMGGWQPRGRDLAIDEVFMPVLVRDENQTEAAPGADASGSQSRTLDFRPSETVTLTAHVYDEKGQPATDCELAVYGTVPNSLRDDDKLRSAWRGRFHSVADQPGLFRVKAPQGLVNATLVDPEIPTGPRQKWTRATNREESIPGPRTEAGWGGLRNDDDSIIVGEPAKTALINPGTHTSGPEPDPARDTGEWGTAIGGLRSRLRLIRDLSQPPASPGKVGQPVFFALEIENVSEAEKQLSVSSVFSLGDVQITGPDGKTCPDVRGPLSVQVRQISIPPGETKAVIERADLTEQFLMTEPGEYRIRAKSPTVSNELSSGDLRITLAEGDVSPIRGVYRDVQSKAPAGSLLVLAEDQLWVFVSGQTKSTDPQGNPVVKLWHRKDSVPAEELPQGVIELKVPNGSGHWYAEIPAGATQQWKTVEQDLLNVIRQGKNPAVSKSEDADPQKPWRAKGRVADDGGKPLAGVQRLWISNFPTNADYTVLRDLTQLRELNMEMSLTDANQLKVLRQALPRTTIQAGTGGGWVGGVP